MAGPIRWDDTSWSDVEAYIAESAPPKRGFDLRKFFFGDLTNDEILWFGVPPDEAYAAARPFLKDEIAAPIANTGRIMAADAGRVVGGAFDAAADAAGEAASSTWNTVAPYVAVGALVFLIYQVRRAS